MYCPKKPVIWWAQLYLAIGIIFYIYIYLSAPVFHVHVNPHACTRTHTHKHILHVAVEFVQKMASVEEQHARHISNVVASFRKKTTESLKKDL